VSLQRAEQNFGRGDRIRSNCSPGALRDAARMLVEIAGQVELTGEGRPN